jgi:hypothetical protein
MRPLLRLRQLIASPGVPGSLFFLVMIIYVVYPLSPTVFLRDGDSSWLIKTGLYIIDHLQLPRQDVIFGNEIPRDWIHYQWGFKVLLGLAYKWAGLNGVVFCCAVLVAATVLLICYWLFETGFHGPSVVFVGLVSFRALLLYASARPFLITNLFTVLLLYLLGRPSPRRLERLILIPLLFLFWANFHLGFMGGLLILCLFIGFDFGKASQQERRLHLMTLGLSLLATGINPYGFGLHLYLYQLARSAEMMAGISELQSIDFHYRLFILVHILFIVAALVYVRSDGRLTEAHYLFLLIGLGMALYSLRHYYLFVFAGAPVAAVFFERVTADLPLLGRDHKRDPLWYGKSVWLIIATLVVAGLVTQARLHSFRFSEEKFPVQAVEILKKLPPGGPTFTGGQWGSYLAWDSGGHRALIDSRFDMYGEAYFKAYEDVYNLKRDWRPFFETHRVQYVLLPADSVLPRVLRADRDIHWELLYEDSQAILLQKQSR